MTPIKDHNALSEDELHRLIDGRLDPARAAILAEHLRRNPEDAARVEAWRAQGLGLHGLYDGVLAEEIPPRLRRAARPWRAAGTALARLVAGFALIAVGGVGGWALRDARPQPDARIVVEFAERAAVAHAVYLPEIRHPVEVVAAEAQHLSVWTSRRLGLAEPLRIPDLRSAGFDLVGGRLLPDAQGPAAQYMYQDGGGRRVTLYVKHDPTTPAAFQSDDQQKFDFYRRGDTSVLAWRDGALGCAIAGNMEKLELKRLAYMVLGYGQDKVKAR
jgi:anti-sigma factor RsiW